MDDALSRFLAATEAGDVDAMMETLAPEAELVSPVSGHMVFRGEHDLRVLLTAVYSTLREVSWRPTIGDGDVRMALGEAKIGPLKVGDAMVFELADDGHIRRIRPHLRPWLALTLFALMLGPKVARDPGVVRRALNR